ncbi:T6SS phospholipase effector Tle1-like catalytic domain-containing protein [Enterobacteriaceae bacterium LUAb1]
MSEIKASVWAPPPFPAAGRLPATQQDVLDNYLKQRKEEDDYLNAFNQQTGRRNGAGFTCSKSLHISFFFDGTGNNDNNDTNRANPTHPTNIAKLFHASYAKEAESDGYFSYYMPGVGTAFPEIGEMNYSDAGLKYATGGENRINWALLRLANAVIAALTKNQKRLDETQAREKLGSMAASWPLSGDANRKAAFYEFLNAEMRAKAGDQTAQPKLLKMKLFIYGFSRGAAEARTFVNWLTELFETPAGADKPEQAILGIPLSIEFLGLLDTVPSVGIAHIAPMCDGHMGWADGTQQLPDDQRFPGLIKCCQHFVSAYEQRLCFPLDSVRRPEGIYPAATMEVVYPGMHSDIGGGYPPGEQGKGLVGDVSNDPNYPGKVLSQIVLHDIYAAAFAAGAPLTVLKETIPDALLQKSPLRVMTAESQQEFDIDTSLIQRFNAWRQTIIAEQPADDKSERRDGETYGYHPHLLSQSLEDTIIDQMGWITAWRIGRYAFRSYATQPFYQGAPERTKAQLAEDAKTREARQSAVEALRKATKQQGKSPAAASAGLGGWPDFEPTIDKTELREAAEEFRSDYLDEFRPQNGWEFAIHTIPKYAVWLINTDDEQAEYDQIKGDGDRLYGKLFTSKQGHVVSDPTMAQVVALFDEQVHDSRAWFMYSTLGTREPWGSYFFYRSIYFGSKSNKDQYLLSVAGQLLGVATLAVGAVYTIKHKSLTGIGVAAGIYGMERLIIDQATGKPVPLLDNAAELFKPTRDPGSLVAQASSQMIAMQHQTLMASAITMLKEAGAKVV